MSFNHSKFFEEAVRQSPASVVITDVHGNIQYVNPKFEHLTGYTLAEVIGKNPRVLNSGYTPPEGYTEMWEKLVNGETWRGIFRNKKKNGEVYWESASISPMQGESGQTTHYMAVKEDNTLQHDSEEALKLAFNTIRVQQMQMLDELEEARETQRRILPQKMPQIGQTTAHVKYVPFGQVGGDYYDVVQVGDDTIAFLIADVTGHGVSAALISCLLSSEFRNALDHIAHPTHVLEAVNSALMDVLPDGHFASAIVGKLDTSVGKLTYTVAGHPDLLIYRAHSGKVERRTTDGMLLGMISKEMAEFACESIRVYAGDRIFLYSDAFIEVEDAKGEQLGIDGFAKLIEDHVQMDTGSCVEGIYADCLLYSKDDGFSDDATILCLHYGG